MATAKTDRQTDKSSRWAFTAYEDQWALFTTIHPGIAEWGWNTEICPKTNRKHYQGYIRLTSQQRFAWLKKLFPGVHLEVSKNWDALVNYCKKEDTRVPGTTPVSQVNTILTHYQYAEEIAKKYYDKYGVSDFDDCCWDKKHTNDKTNLISVCDRITALAHVDIQLGRRYIMWIIGNPSWDTSWRKSWKPYILSYHSIEHAPSNDWTSSQVRSLLQEAPCS